MLKASPRNWIVAISPARNSFTRLVFRFHWPGPNRMLRPELPNANCPGARKAAGSNQRVIPGLSTSGLIPVASARVEYQPAIDGVYVTLKGSPERICASADRFQPPMNWLNQPLLL